MSIRESMKNITRAAMKVTKPPAKLAKVMALKQLKTRSSLDLRIKTAAQHNGKMRFVLR